jgi:tRNA G46 methylase TrmB
MHQVNEIQTNQLGPHEDLHNTVIKHLNSEFKRPIAQHTQQAFEDTLLWLSDWHGEVYLDACCGVGESTLNLAQRHPNVRIIGVDKSALRLQKHGSYVHKSAKHDNIKSQNISVLAVKNYRVIQADLNDFWRLLRDTIEQSPARVKWKLTKQFVFYPNPYPKKSQLGKRWHGSAVFPDIMACCSNIEIRSNWRIYVEEFITAMSILGYQASVEALLIDSHNPPITPFERKYAESGQALWTATTRGTGNDR